MSRRRKNGNAAAVKDTDGTFQALGQYEAARWSPNRAIPFWPNLNPRTELSDGDLLELWRVGRSLYANNALVSMAVTSIVDLCGWLMPIPRSSDKEWNKKARKWFCAYALNPQKFSATGTVNFKAAQLWLEERATVDGDALSVLTRGKDGMPQVAFFDAPQVGGSGAGNVLGVQVDDAGRLTGYHLLQGVKEPPVFVRQGVAFLYRHRPSPIPTRGVSPLASAYNSARDTQDINVNTLAGQKLASSYAIVEEKPADDRAARQQGIMDEKRAARQAAASGQPAPVVPPAVEEPLSNVFGVGGVHAYSGAPGRKLSILHDNRPATEYQAFYKSLVRHLAYACGIDPETLYYLSDMGSASVRFSLSKLKRRTAVLLEVREQWCSWVYRHLIGGAIAARELPAPRAADWENVQWVGLSDMTIDKGREMTATINGVREGLVDADTWTLATEGLEQSEILRRRAAMLREVKDLAEEYGVSAAEILSGSIGSNAPAVADDAAPADGEKSSSAPTPPADVEPESAN